MKLGAIGAIGAIGAVVMLVGADAHAQAPMDVSLADAVNVAIEREPLLRAARAEVDAVRGMRQQAGLRPNPSASFERREEPAGTDNQTMVQVSVPLDLFRRSARIDAADREIEVVDRSVADRTRMLVNDVKMKYAQAAAAIREQTIAADLAALAQRELELLTRRVDEGASPPLDRDLLNVQVRRFESARLLSAARADTRMFELKRAIGLAAAVPVTLRDTLEILATAAPPAAAGVTPQRPDVLEAEARVRLADARIGQATAEGRFDLSVFGSYTRMDAGFPQLGFGVTGDLERIRGVFHYVSAGAMVMMPLWNQNQGQVDAARAERVAAAARLDAVQLTADAERAAAQARVMGTRDALDLIAAGVRLARQNLDVVRQTYDLGRGTLADVLNHQQQYLEIENEYTTALRDAVEARAALEFAQGEWR